MGPAAFHWRIVVALLLWSTAAVFLRRPLESTMPTHALVQLPLLAAAGALLVSRPHALVGRPFAIPILLIALFGAAVWMLPRTIDASLAEPAVEVAKLTTLPLLVGLPLRWSWFRLGDLTRAFVWANLVSMLLTLAWLYRAAPVRVCSYYVLADQQALGLAYLVLAAVVVAGALPGLFFGSPRERLVERGASLCDQRTARRRSSDFLRS